MSQQKLLPILEEILNTPTAPFHEYLMRDTLTRLLQAYAHVELEHDAFGNLLATYRRGRKPARYAFAAHMDHPGWVRPAPKKEEIAWEFLGGVPAAYLEKPKIVPFGEFAMWDLPAFEFRDGKIYSRACDDLVGCSVIVALFHELEMNEVEATVHGIFTRAEEVGFVGAVELAKNWPYPEEVRFVSLETSAPVPGLEMGQGPVIRVGDRLSIFDDMVTSGLVHVATESKLPFQRGLLDRGSCEATAMQAMGIPSAGLSILLGNYHNCGPENRIESEYVSFDDVRAEVSLLRHLVEHTASENGQLASDSHQRLREQFDARFRKYREHMDVTRDRFSPPAAGEETQSA